MKPSTALAAALQLLLALATASPLTASAQTTYKCTRTGSVFYSDRPCDTEVHGLAASGASAMPRLVPRESPTHWRFMTPACRQRAERIRDFREQVAGGPEGTGPYQRLAAEEELYGEECTDDESQALDRAEKLQSDHRATRRAELLQQRAEEARIELTLAQCNEMRRIRDNRQSRLDTMTVGERADFERFESAFVSRCQRVAPR